MTSERAFVGERDLGEAEQGNVVTLSLPASPEFFILARMSASAIGARVDFDVEEIEDLKLAVNEMCTLCAAGGESAARLTLRYCWDEDSVVISCECGPVSADLESPDSGVRGLSEAEFSQRLLSELVDECECEDVVGGVRRSSMRKRRTAQA